MMTAGREMIQTKKAVATTTNMWTRIVNFRVDVQIETKGWSKEGSNTSHTQSDLTLRSHRNRARNNA